MILLWFVSRLFLQDRLEGSHFGVEAVDSFEFLLVEGADVIDVFHFGQPPQQLIVAAGIVKSLLLLRWPAIIAAATVAVVVVVLIEVVVGRIHRRRALAATAAMVPAGGGAAGAGSRRSGMADALETRAHLLLPLELLGGVVFRFLSHQIGRSDRQMEQNGRKRRSVSRFRVPAHPHQKEEARRNRRRKRQVKSVGAHAVNDGSLINVTIRTFTGQQFP